MTLRALSSGCAARGSYRTTWPSRSPSPPVRFAPLAEARDDGLQVGADHLVAGVVAVRVVDRLESVHVEEDDRERRVLVRIQDRDGEVDHEVALGQAESSGIAVATGLELLLELR